MTDAQIALYAALRVAVPAEWQISIHTTDVFVAYFSRPVFAAYASGEPRRQIGIEKMAMAVDCDFVERGPHRFVVAEALALLGGPR